MTPVTNMITAYTGLLALLTAAAGARHVHRQSSHKHPRQLVVPNVAAPSLTTPSPPVITAGNAALEDIQDIQSGLSDLPGNILAFIHAVEQRLNDMEQALQSLVSSPSHPTSPPSEHPTIPTAMAMAWSTFLPPPPPPPTTSSGPATSTSTPVAGSTTPTNPELPRSTRSIVLPAPYAPPATSSTFATTTYTSRVTSTRTRTSTSTARGPLATGTGAAPYRSINGTVVASSLPAGTGATYPVSLPLSQTFATTLRAAATLHRR